MINFINSFEVPQGRDDEFMALWTEVNTYMRAKPGYISHRMHRSLSPEARYRYVNYVQWESVEHWQAAHDEGFRKLVGRPEWKAFSSNPVLYDLVHEGRAR